MKKALFLSLLAIMTVSNAYAKTTINTNLESVFITSNQDKTVSSESDFNRFDGIVLQAFSNAEKIELEKAIEDVKASFSSIASNQY